MYVSQWETLADALARVLATGMEPEQAKQQICAAIADGAIPVRVKIDKNEHDIPGRNRLGRGQIVPPVRLRPDDLDWFGSKPRGTWDTGPDPVESYYAFWGWRSRRIAILELGTHAVIRIFCCPVPDTEAGSAALPTASHEPRPKAPQAPPVPVPIRRGGGRRPQYPWQSVQAELRKRLEDDGAPADGDGGQAELERFVAEQFPPDACPAESTIRTIVRKEIEAFRGDLEGR